MSAQRLVSARLGGVVHHAIISALDRDIREAVVGDVPVKLPVRLLCWQFHPDLRFRDAWALPCTNEDVDCMACVAVGIR